MDHLNEYRERCRNDPRLDGELIQMVLSHLADPEDEVYWAAMAVLHGRFNAGMFAEAVEWSRASDAGLRRAAADLLAQAHVGDSQFENPAGEVLLKMIAVEENPETLASLAFALGHNSLPEKVPVLVKLQSHANARVRHGVAYGLAGCDDGIAVDALINLSRDAASEVRDWAMFALGSQTELDTESLREALWSRVADPDDETKGEAVVGLAVRRDARVIPVIEELLKQPRAGYLPVQAAREFPQPTFLEPLRLLRARIQDTADWRLELVNEAIEACSRTNH